jgi:hypothetical protein
MHGRPTKRTCSLGLMAISLLAGCAATTSLTLTPSSQPALCQRSPERINAVVLWGTRWRVDQKDVTDRETAANNGIARFFQESGCFASVEIRRLSSPQEPHEQAAAMANNAAIDVVLVVVVRELGPILKLGSSAALIEGGTEVVVDFAAYQARAATPTWAFSAHWQNGGPGVVKGVASLPADIEAALAASLQPEPK